MTEQDRVFAKCAWRLVPFMGLLYVVNYIDRVNVGFAALTMNKELGFSPSIYGFGAGIFFFSYALCQVPASMMIARIGPRRGIFWILLIWGALSAANAFVWSPASFYVVRFFLGIAEAGFFPGMVFYLTLWFPKDYLGRSIAGFQAANPLAFVVGGPLSGLLLGMDGTFSLSGWQWLFLAEGLPACILAFAVYRWMPDGPADASWLDRDEKAAIASRHHSDGVAEHLDIRIALKDWRVFGIGVVAIGVIFCITGVQLWVPQIVQAMGFANETVGAVVAVPFVCATAAMILWGYASDLREERIWHIALAALFTALGLIIASISTSHLLVLLGLTITIVGQFSALPVINTLLPSLLRGPALAGGIALYNTMAQFGGFFGPIVIGVLKQETNGYAAGLIALAVGVTSSAVVILALGRALSPRAVSASIVRA
jgi:ACS family tartrate transporter-like MFS transporter